MASKVISWTKKAWKENLQKRLKAAQRHREPYEQQWVLNGNIVYSPLAREAGSNMFNITFDNIIELESGDVDEGDSELGTNYTFKFVRHRLGQLSANPPSVITKPTSSDLGDRRKADAADRIVRHGYQNLNVEEHFNRALQKALVRGIGWLKCVWNPDRGDVFDFTDETKEIEMSGDIEICSPSTFDVWVDPIARSWEEVRYIIERHFISLEEACFRFPDSKKLLKGALVKDNESYQQDRYSEDVVEIYEYYEKGLPVNGMAGRHAYFTKSGELLDKPTKNPHYQARLPYHQMTDIDVEDTIYGKSNVEYVSRKQSLLNRFDSASVDAMEAHGVIRMAVPEAAEINDDNMSNSNYDIIQYSGAIPPHFINPSSLPPDMPRLREQMRGDIQEMMGMNDAMLGVQKREQSGFSQQTSIEAGNIANRRLFNKFTLFVKEFWEDYLGLVKENWDLARTINVVGKEKALLSKDIKGADIAGGYDLIVEYGSSLPLDPNMRREQIMLLMEPLQAAGIPMQRILKMLKLNELDAIYDELDMGEDRQREIFDEMIAQAKIGEPQYIEPEELENHAPMLIFAQKYRNSMEYKSLPDDIKPLIEQHIRARMEMAASVAQGGQAGQPAGPTAQPPGGMPPGGGDIPQG